MKNLTEYLTESKNFKLSDSEREILANVVGILCGNYEEDEMNDKLNPLINELSDEEKEQLSELSDVLDDSENYKSINRSILKTDIPLIIKVINWMDDNDAWVAHNDYELLDILDKLTA